MARRICTTRRHGAHLRRRLPSTLMPGVVWARMQDAGADRITGDDHRRDASLRPGSPCRARKRWSLPRTRISRATTADARDLGSERRLAAALQRDRPRHGGRQDAASFRLSPPPAVKRR